MQQSRLTKYLEALSPRDRDRFRQFVYSPYFNQHGKTQELLDLILQKTGKGASPDRKVLFAGLFPGEAFEEQKLHNLMAGLMKLYHRFLAVEFFQKEPFTEEVYTLEGANEQRQFDVLTNRARQLEKQLESYPFRDTHFHLASFRLNQLLGFYITENISRTFSPNMQQMMNQFDYYYLALKLKYCCDLTVNMMVMNTHYDFSFLDDLLRIIRDNWEIYGQQPMIELNYTILMSIREEDNPGHYLHLKEIMAGKNLLAPPEQAYLYHFANNYCIRQINLGKSQYQQELFQLYQQGLRSGHLFVNGMLSEWNYKNIVTLGCKLKEFEWTHNFIEEYKHKLPPNQQENAYKFNLATYFHSKHMYRETLSTLLHVQFTDVKYHLNTNFLLLRTYYAMHDTEALLGLIDTFRIYVIRNRKMTTDEKRSYINFLRFAKKLVLLRHQEGAFSKKVLRERLTSLAQQIEQTENVINSYWLLEECRLEKEEVS